jgi:hypothetical protein
MPRETDKIQETCTVGDARRQVTAERNKMTTEADRRLTEKPMAAQPHSDAEAPQRKSMSSDVRRHLGLKLRQAYAQLVSEPVPQRLIELLQELHAKERSP